MKTHRILTVLLTAATLALPISHGTRACTRLIYEGAGDRYLTARSMDWQEDIHSDLWIFPRGLKRDGGAGPGSIEWTSKYGSVVVSGYDIGSADGMNEKGLVVNLLYLAEAEFGAAGDKPVISVGAWAQYILDNHATVADAVAALRAEPFRILGAVLPNGAKTSLHVAISDAGGDSAILEYIDGRLVIHHGRQYRVMTNSPVFDQQLALNAYWEQIGGVAMLPGTSRAADRFARASYYVRTAPKFKDERMAVGGAFGVIRNASVPLGVTDPARPNIASTIWRTVADHQSLRYYYESAISPNVFWVDLGRVDFTAGSGSRKLELEGHPTFAGDVSGKFLPAEPFKWLNPRAPHGR